MKDCEEKMACAIQCSRCEKKIGPGDERILSVYDHEPICWRLQAAGKDRPDYKETSEAMIGQCMADSELHYGEPARFAFITSTPINVDAPRGLGVAPK